VVHFEFYPDQMQRRKTRTIILINGSQTGGIHHNVRQMCSGTASLLFWVFIQNDGTTLQVANQSLQNTLNINCEVSNNETTSVFLLFIYLFIYLLFI
jgi:hypothetical protein